MEAGARVCLGASIGLGARQDDLLSALMCPSLQHRLIQTSRPLMKHPKHAGNSIKHWSRCARADTSTWANCSTQSMHSLHKGKEGSFVALCGFSLLPIKLRSCLNQSFDFDVCSKYKNDVGFLH